MNKQTQEALKIAIEALEHESERSIIINAYEEVIDACKEALATNEKSSEVQPAQEPFYFVQHSNGYGWINVDKDEYNQEKYDENKWKLYTHPAPKPVAIVESHYGFTDAIVTFLTFNNEQLPVGTLLYANPTFELAQGIELEWYNKGWDDAYTEALNLSEKQHTFPDKLDIANCDLKQPAQEPVAYILRNEYNEYRLEPMDNLKITDFPVEVEVKLYTYPHQWQGLTDDEINNLLFDDFGIDIDEWFKYARAIEAKLKENNNVGSA